MSILDILESIAAVSGKKDKESILLSHQDNEILKKVCELAYSPTVQFYIKKIPDGWQHDDRRDTDWEEVLNALKKFSDRIVTGNVALEVLTATLNSVDRGVAEVICRIIKKDLKCGIGKNTINKVWKGLIVVPPRQGASSMNEKSLAKMKTIKNLTIELKSDGSYAASVCGENTTMMSRNGNPLEIGCLQEHLSCGSFDGFALEGELVYSLDKATREEGNGIITKIVKGTASDQEKDNALYQVWDCILTDHYEPKGEYPLPNTDRRTSLEVMMKHYSTWCADNNVNEKITLIPRKEDVTVEEAFEIFEDYVRQGFEGAIVKDMDAPWKDVGKPSHCIKLKRKEPADLKVVGWYEAEKGSKYEGLLGGLHCESRCGRIKVDVGSGFSDEERRTFVDNIPSVIEVEYDSITKNKNTGQESLFLPIYKRPRYDKLAEQSDDYQNILDKQRIK